MALDQPIPLPGYVREAISRLSSAGHVAYVVGGCVRDHLLDLPTHDFDIATSASPDEITRLFPDAVTVGKAFGVLKVPLRGRDRASAEFLEIATFREDLDYKDGRRPTGVRFSGPVEDARRRDFTINGLFYDPKRMCVLDAVGGMGDLQAGVVRAIGQPDARFKEDALRLLRAVRFSARFGFEIEPGTGAAIAARARLVDKVSAERVRDELQGMLVGPDPAGALLMMAELGLLSFVLPSLDRMRRGRAGEWKAKLALLRALGAEPEPVVAWAALFLGVSGIEEECERLRHSRATCKAVVWMVEALPKYREIFSMREATLRRFLKDEHFESGLALFRAVCLAETGDLIAYESWRRIFLDDRAADAPRGGKLLTGEDLIGLGLKPGPRFAEILRQVEDMALERKLRTKEEALEWVIQVSATRA